MILSLTFSEIFIMERSQFALKMGSYGFRGNNLAVVPVGRNVSEKPEGAKHVAGDGALGRVSFNFTQA